VAELADAPDLGFVTTLPIIQTENNCQGFKVEAHGDVRRRDAQLSGLWLVAEKWVEAENQPF